jgi:hypothetical protein
MRRIIERRVKLLEEKIPEERIFFVDTGINSMGETGNELTYRGKSWQQHESETKENFLHRVYIGLKECGPFPIYICV